MCHIRRVHPQSCDKWKYGAAWKIGLERSGDSEVIISIFAGQDREKALDVAFAEIDKIKKLA